MIPAMKNVLIIADPVEKWDPVGETTFCLLAEASKRPLHIFHCTPEDLRFENGKHRAVARKISVQPKRELLDQFTYELDSTARDLEILKLNAVLLRKDPPADLFYQQHLQLLTPIEDQVLFCNRPSAVLKWNEKLAILAFPDLAPKSLIHIPSTSGRSFPADPLIRKNLLDSQARGVRNLTGPAAEAERSTLEKGYVMDQAFNPKVAKGDKRILLINGKVVGAFVRIPKEGEWRSNTRYGSTIHPTELSGREKTIVRRLTAWAGREKVFLVGLDVIDQRLSEVNLTSVRGLLEYQKAGGPDLAPLFWDRLLAR
jgi:glutathione synthase